jgi:hypothetical protein
MKDLGMDNIWFASAPWIGLALIASAMQAWVAVSVALLEIITGAIGNLVDLKLTPWVNYPAGFGAIRLTFLAGAEIDVKVIRRNFGSTLAIGVVGFIASYLGVLAWALSSRDGRGQSPDRRDRAADDVGRAAIAPILSRRDRDCMIMNIHRCRGLDCPMRGE